MNANVISFKRIQKQKITEKCSHHKIGIDENWICYCSICGAVINPAKWIYDLAKKEDNLPYHITELETKVAKLKNRLRTQCVHCRKMTPINK